MAKLQETNYINAEVAGCGVFKDFLFLLFFLLLAVISDVKIGKLFFCFFFSIFFLPLCHPSKTLNELNVGPEDASLPAALQSLAKLLL